MSSHLFLWFHCSEEEKEDDSFSHLLQWLYFFKMAICTFFGGFVAKNVMTTMSSASSMMVVM
jgi:hypothetical protein